MTASSASRRAILPAVAVFALVLGFSSTSYAQQGYIMSAEDFDLQTVVSLVNPATGRGVRNLVELEGIINDPHSAINNVDIDQDGVVDYVGCVEIRGGAHHIIEFRAYPSSAPGAAPVVIATLAITRNHHQRLVVLQGSYPYYVYGYDSWFYHDTFYYHHGFARRTFLGWWFMTRPIYRPVYWGCSPYRYRYGGRVYYHPRNRLPYHVIRNRRHSFYGQRGIRIIHRRPRPHGYHRPGRRPAPPPAVRRYGRPGHRYHRPGPPVVRQPRRPHKVTPPPRHRQPPHKRRVVPAPRPGVRRAPPPRRVAPPPPRVRHKAPPPPRVQKRRQHRREKRPHGDRRRGPRPQHR